jgi:hypothetical protein
MAMIFENSYDFSVLVRATDANFYTFRGIRTVSLAIKSLIIQLVFYTLGCEVP